MPETFALLFWPIATLFPCLFLVKWVHGLKGPSPLWDWRGALLGITAMLLAWGSEIAITRLGHPSSDFWLIVVVPAIEESWRWIFLLLLSKATDRTGTVSRATWVGAFMGVTETFLKLLTTINQDRNPGFRMLVTGPFHALLGGILWRGMLGQGGPGATPSGGANSSCPSTSAFLPITTLLHGLFNAAIMLSTSRGSTPSWGYLICLAIVWVAGVFWLYGAIEEGEIHDEARKRDLEP